MTGQGRQGSIIQSSGTKVQDGRQGQVRQRSVSRVVGQRFRTSGRLRADRKGQNREKQA